MARTTKEAVMISRSKFDRLKRDAAILDLMESDYRRQRPDGPTLRSLFGGLVDSAGRIDAILAAHVRRLEARDGGSNRPDPAPSSKTA